MMIILLRNQHLSLFLPFFLKFIYTDEDFLQLVKTVH